MRSGFVSGGEPVDGACIMKKSLKSGRLLLPLRRPALSRRATAVFLLAIAGLLLSCGGESQPATFTPRSADPPTAATDMPAESIETPTAATETPAEATETPTATPQTLTSLQIEARQVLSDRLSVPADRLELVSDEAVQWGDTSLGCP